MSHPGQNTALPIREAENKRQARRLQWRADLALLGVVVIWGVNIPIMKLAISAMDEFLFNALRLTLSALALWICVFWQRSVNPVAARQSWIPNRSKLAGVATYVVLGGFAYQVLFLVGINSTTAGNAAIILSAIPAWTALLAFLLLKERLSLASAIGLAVAMSGVAIVTLAKPQVAESIQISGATLTGNLLISAAAFSWAMISVISRKIMQSVSPLMLAFYCTAFTVPLHFGVAMLMPLVSEQSVNDFGWVPVYSRTVAALSTPWLLAAIIFSGVFSTGLATAMWNFGVKNLGAAHASGFQNLVPLIALFSGWLFLAELPFPLQLAGGALIITGMLVMRRYRTRVQIV